MRISFVGFTQKSHLFRANHKNYLLIDLNRLQAPSCILTRRGFSKLSFKWPQYHFDILRFHWVVSQ
jgi:hypothetical protein